MSVRWETRNGINNINQLNNTREKNKKLKDKSDKEEHSLEEIKDISSHLDTETGRALFIKAIEKEFNIKLREYQKKCFKLDYKIKIDEE